MNHVRVIFLSTGVDSSVYLPSRDMARGDQSVLSETGVSQMPVITYFICKKEVTRFFYNVLMFGSYFIKTIMNKY